MQPLLPRPHLRRALPATLILLASGLVGPAQGQAPPVVEVSEPLVRTITDWDEYTGRFQAVETVVLRPRVSGHLQSIHFEEGDLVEAGALLYRIDPRTFEAEVAEARARLDAAEARRGLAAEELWRAQELLQRDVGPERDVTLRRAELRQAAAEVALAEAELERARLDLGFTRITAPISGRISETAVDVGNLVIGGAGGATTLANIVSVDPIELAFTVSEADFLRYARLFAAGDRPSSRETANPVQVQLMDEDGWPRSGRMSFVDNRLDEGSGTLLGKALLDNADGFLQPGLFARVRLPGSAEYEAMLVPDEAIVADQRQRLVYVVAEDGTVAARAIEPGPLYRGLRVVRSGLAAGDRVVVSGVQRARPGARVTAVPAPLRLAAGD